uniref:Bifunctional lysine-specific demethylase and histidyl-hydroxylase n=1 Tax=Schistocephalus solidus TaxID=70667 RepID=A0A0V0J1Q0_SCHSO
MLSAVDFYNSQKSKTLTKEKAEAVQKTASLVKSLTEDVKKLQDPKYFLAQKMNQKNIPEDGNKSKKKNKRNKNRNKNQTAAESKTNQTSGSKPTIPIKTVNSAADKPTVLPSKPDQQQGASVPNQAQPSKKQRKRRRKSASQPNETVSSTGPFAKRLKTTEKVPDSEIIPYLVGQKTEEEEVDSDDLEEIEVESLGDPTDESSSDFDISTSDSDEEDDEDDEEEGEQEPPIEPIAEANDLLRALIEPVSTDVFTSDYYGKKPLHLSGGAVREHFRSFFSLSEVATWLYKEHLMFGEDVDLIHSSDEAHITPRPSGRAFQAVVWSHFNAGYSVRFNCPERFSLDLAENLHLLQEVLGGPLSSTLLFANSAFSGSILPDDADCDIFLLQLEGSATLSFKQASDSVTTFTLADKSPAKGNSPKSEVSIESGDVVYIPRKTDYSLTIPAEGHAIQLCFLHYGASIVETRFSEIFAKVVLENQPRFSLLHQIARAGAPAGHRHPFPNLVSATLKFSLLPLFEGVVAALGDTAGTPSASGDAGNAEVSNKKRRSAQDKQAPTGAVKRILTEITDEMTIALLRRTSAPILHPSEAACHVSQQGEIWYDPNDRAYSDNEEDVDTPAIPGRVAFGVELEPDTRIRLVRRSAVHLPARLPKGTPTFRVYHCLSNSRDCRRLHPPFFLELPKENYDMVHHVVYSYPEFVTIDELPGESIDDRILLANKLYDAGLVITDSCLPECPWNDSDSDDDDNEEDEHEVDLDNDHHGEEKEEEEQSDEDNA